MNFQKKFFKNFLISKPLLLFSWEWSVLNQKRSWKIAFTNVVNIRNLYLWNSREVKIVLASPEKLLTPTLAGYLSNDHFSIKWTFIKREFRGIAKGKSNLNGFHRDDAQENWVIKQGLFINRVLLWRYIYFVYENKKKSRSYCVVSAVRCKFWHCWATPIPLTQQ